VLPPAPSPAAERQPRQRRDHRADERARRARGPSGVALLQPHGEPGSAGFSPRSSARR